MAISFKKKTRINWQHPAVIKKMGEAYVRIIVRRHKKLEEFKKLEKKRKKLEELRKLENKRRLFADKKRTTFQIKRTRKALNKKVTTYAPATMKLNTTFFSAADGVYNSYWVGKLISTLLHQGKKKIVTRALYHAFTIIKYTLNSNPLLLFLETLEKIRPTFRLRNRIVRRVVIKQYPIVSYRSRQFMIALHWLKAEIQKGSGLFGQSLAQEIASKLLDFHESPKKNDLTKKRIEYTKRTIMGQFNIRYNWK